MLKSAVVVITCNLAVSAYCFCLSPCLESHLLTSHLIFARASAVSQTWSLSSPLPLLFYYQICKKQLSAKDDERAWADEKRTLLCFQQLKKTFSAEMTDHLKRHMSTTTLNSLSLRYREIDDTITSPGLSPSVFTNKWQQFA